MRRQKENVPLNKKSSHNLYGDEMKDTDKTAVLGFIIMLSLILLLQVYGYFSSDNQQKHPYDLWMECAQILTDRGEWVSNRTFVDNNKETVSVRMKLYETDDYVLRYIINEKLIIAHESIECIDKEKNNYIFQMRSIIDKVKNERRFSSSFSAIEYDNIKKVIRKVQGISAFEYTNNEAEATPNQLIERNDKNGKTEEVNKK